MNINDIITESQQKCPHCGGPLMEYSDLMEKKDACYYKVKASAKVWPSAYASGRLVQCRKKGAGNYGNKSEGVAEGTEQSLSSMVNQDQSERNEYKNFVKSQAGGNWSKGAKMYAQLKKRPSNDIFGDASRLNQFMKMKFDFDKFTDEDWDNYWLLAQHCDDNRDFQKNALSIIKKYQGTDHSHYKYLYDRISMGLTGKQKYGTQNVKEQGVAEAFGPLPRDNQQIRLGRHTVDIERVGEDKNYIGFAWHDSKGQEHYEEVSVGDLGSYDDLIDRIKQEISYQERQYTDQGVAEAQLDEKCWDGYQQQGTKNKSGRQVPNCVPVTEDLDPDQQFDMIEDMVEQLAESHGVDSDEIWEDFESVDDHELYETAAWRRKEGKSARGGLNAKGVASYRRENPGSKLQTAVTTKPSKLKPGSKAAKRRKSFCARMGGVKGPMKKPNGKPTRKALALRKWNC